MLLISGHTSSPQRGRWASQETSAYTMPQDALYTSGPLFDFAARLESAAELPEVLRRVTSGLARPGGFVAHICLPMSVQSARVSLPALRPHLRVSVPTAPADEVADCARLLKSGPFAIWVGFGATEAAAQVRELVDRSGAKVFCSPRAKASSPRNTPPTSGSPGSAATTR